MKHSVPFRIVVERPLPGVMMKVQHGRDDLLAPSSTTASSIAFEFDLTVDLDGGELNFLGHFAQGPKVGRFIYINSGTYAGQAPTCWSRRAKLSLMSITRDQVDEALANSDSRIEPTISSVGSDGGPTCATVKGIKWRVVRR